MERFNKTLIGRQVRFINAKAHEEMPEYYPEVGTIGIICYYSYNVFYIWWLTGFTSMNNIRICCKESLEFVEEIINYTPEKYGIVEAIKIFYGKACWPYATLAFAYGGTVTIDWADVKEREKYSRGINAYTLFIDERVKNKFEDYVRVRT